MRTILNQIDGGIDHEQEDLQELRREQRTLREEVQELHRSLDQLEPSRWSAFVEHERQSYRVATLCRVLGVSSSGYWAWRARPPSARARRDQELLERIVAIHEASGRVYGAPRIQAELAAQGVRCGRKRVARLMRTHGLVGRSARV